VPGWGRPGGPTVAASWGKPVAAIGANTTYATSPWPSAESSSQPKLFDLLPDERRAKELLEKRQPARPRPVVQHTGAGPQHTRAGRPEPVTTHLVEPRDQWTQDASYRKRRVPEEKARVRGQFSIRRTGFRHSIGDIDRTPHANKSTDVPELSQWNQLRRRVDKHPLPSPTPSNVPFEPLRPVGQGIAEDPFLAARERREVEAQMSTYTPLSSNQRIAPIQNFPPGTPAELEERRKTAEAQAGERRKENERRRAIEARRLEILEAEQDDRAEKPVVTSKRIFLDRKASDDVEELDDEIIARRELRKERRKKKSRYEPAAAEPVVKGKEKDKARRRGQFIEDAEEAEQARVLALDRAEQKRQRKLEKAAKKAAAPTLIMLPEYISVSNLAMALKVKLDAFVEKMEELGFEDTSSDYILNGENAGLIAMEYNYEAIIDRGESEDLRAREPAPDPSILPQRPPVVTIMGHVDHGKTTLLDYLRKSSVAATEHGGITQHIGAFSVPMPSGKLITFLDTPGHAAFLNMRQRGAYVTDIVILVVAADDSVKPQTIEAINHAKSAKVPIIVAINKIDKEDTNVERVKQDLARHGVDVEDFGGDTQAICVSGKTGQGMKELEEAAVTLSEILDMRAETDGTAEGWVLEASIKAMGKVATVLVRRGTMRVGDFIVAGKTWARIRCLRNEAGAEIESAGPGTPVEIDGWREQPLAGDEVLQAPDEAKAKSVVEYRLEKEERDRLAEDMEAINEYRKNEQEKRDAEKEAARLVAEAEEAGTELIPEVREEKSFGPKEVYFIIKGDVSGSVEAVIDSVCMLGNAEIRPKILRSGVGQISEFDIEHAAAAKGVVINFNTDVEPTIVRQAEQNKVKIIDHNIIYRLVDDVKAELSKHLKPLVTQKVLGEAEIAQIFSITVKGRQQKSIAGCKVRNGTIVKTALVRVHRGEEKVFDGTLFNFLYSLHNY
jgi:translation initiation factor IF-2